MSTQTKAGGTFATDSALGAVDWTSAGNAALSDDSRSTSILLLGQLSRYLKVTNFNFNIPLDATITGVTVSIERSTDTLNATHDNSVKLVKSGVISGNEKAVANLWPTSDATATYGSATDLWGLTFTPTIINASDFGVVVSAIADLAGTAQIDYISIAVDYIGSNRPGNDIRHISVGNGMSRNDLAS